MTAPTLNSAELARILDDALAGSRMSETEAAALFRLNGRDIWKVAAAADERREEVVGDTVTYVRNMNLHMTNRTVCIWTKAYRPGCVLLYRRGVPGTCTRRSKEGGHRGLLSGGRSSRIHD